MKYFYKDHMTPDLPAPATPSNIFLDRELSQLMFNRRVMAQAEDKSIPLLERWLQS